VEFRRGQTEQSLARFSQALGFLLRTPAEEQLTPPVVSLTASILSNMSPSFAVLGRLGEAAEGARRSASLCSVGSRATLGNAMINLAAAYCRSGRLEEALQCVDQGAALHEEFGDQMRVCDALIVRSEVKRRMG